MAISIDTIYQRVLAVANKEQRGYLTPQEFNLLANQAQQDIFDQYFYDLSQFKKMPSDPTTPMSDMVELIKNKLAPFTTVQDLIGGTLFPSNYRTGRIFVMDAKGNYTATKVDQTEAQWLIDSTFHLKGLEKNPIYRESLLTGQDIEVFNHTGQVFTGVKAEIIQKPVEVEWGYSVIGEKALYNAGRSTDSELHQSEESEFVTKILLLGGIIMKQNDVVQASGTLEQSKIEQEKNITLRT